MFLTINEFGDCSQVNELDDSIKEAFSEGIMDIYRWSLETSNYERLISCDDGVLVWEEINKI